jgi:fumarate reductase flavoprotein subunit
MTSGDASYEVLVIGGGISGLVAANRAAELGKRTAVLERGTDDRYLCSTRYTGGTFHICLTDLMSGPEKLAETIEAATRGFARKDLAGAVAKDGLRLVRWLQGEGIKFVNLGHYHSFVLAPPSRTGPGLDWEGRGGDVLLRTLEANLLKRKSGILRGTRALALDVATPGWIKVECERAGRKSWLNARSVVIADGGFPADIELVREHITPVPEKILQRNARTATGDGLRMALALGAATVGMDCFYGHLLSRDAMHNDKLWPRPYVDALLVAGLLVDGEGRRFADEGEGHGPPDLAGAGNEPARARESSPAQRRRHAAPGQYAVGARRNDGRARTGAAGNGRSLQPGAGVRHAGAAHPAPAHRSLQGASGQDAALLRRASVHRHHQYDGRAGRG